MLFLLNDMVFDLDGCGPDEARRFERLSFDHVLDLGCELFAEEPLLHRADPARARRLAWLIADRSEGAVNAALFAAPSEGCAAELVEPRFCFLPSEIMQLLRERAGVGRLDPETADRFVWGRMAA